MVRGMHTIALSLYLFKRILFTRLFDFYEKRVGRKWIALSMSFSSFFLCLLHSIKKENSRECLLAYPLSVRDASYICIGNERLIIIFFTWWICSSNLLSRVDYQPQFSDPKMYSCQQPDYKEIRTLYTTVAAHQPFFFFKERTTV